MVISQPKFGEPSIHPTPVIDHHTVKSCPVPPKARAMVFHPEAPVQPWTPHLPNVQKFVRSKRIRALPKHRDGFIESDLNVFRKGSQLAQGARLDLDLGHTLLSPISTGQRGKGLPSFLPGNRALLALPPGNL